MKNKLIYLSLLISIFSACKPDDPEKPDNNNTAGQTLTVKFNDLFGLEKINWSSYYITAAGDSIRFDKLKFILSEFTLEKSNGEFVTLPGTYAYLSIRDGRDSVIVKNVPKGTYKSFRFKVGLDSAINHSDPAVYALDHPLSPALNEMHWGWAGGYIFNVIEGYFKNNGANAGFSFHIALVRNSRIHSFVQNYEISGNHRLLIDLRADRYFSNIVNFSLKNDGSFSHSGDVDPVMDKFIQNVNGIFEFNSFK